MKPPTTELYNRMIGKKNEERMGQAMFTMKELQQIDRTYFNIDQTLV